MAGTCFNIPGVARIGYVVSRHLPANTALRGLCDIEIPVFSDITWLPFYGEPTCIRTTEKVNGSRLDTTKLTFNTPKAFSSYGGLSFVVVGVDGAAYLIGQAEPPYPTIKWSLNMGTTAETCGSAYEIEHKSICSLMPCRIVC